MFFLKAALKSTSMEKQTHLMTQETPKSRNRNSRSTKLCFKGWPCKEVRCTKCLQRRRKYFISRGYLHYKDHDLSSFSTVAWVGKKYKNTPWQVLALHQKTFSKKCSGAKFGHYVRVGAVGKENTPHLHLVHHPRAVKKLERICKKLWGTNDCHLTTKPVISPLRLLGYLFDRNFEPSVLDVNRPKRMRILSASRPMSVAFPTGQKEKELWERLNPKRGAV
jgi:hypothetical protein